MASEHGGFATLLVIQLLAAVVLFGVIIFWPGQWNAMRWTGAVIAAPALVMLFVARYQLGKSFSVTAQARKLVTNGVYSKIRNPIYVFSGLMVLGFALTLQGPVLVAILLVLIPLQVIRARKEAKVLEDAFGDQYREYRKRTWF